MVRNCQDAEANEGSVNKRADLTVSDLGDEGTTPSDKDGSASTSGISKTDLSLTSETLPDQVLIMNSNSNGETTYARLDDPKIVLYDRKKVRLGWQDKMPVGSGFVNLGNSCYLNATLQTLFHTPAFINWLFSDEEHRRKCRTNNQSIHQCIICPMASTAYEAYYRSNNTVRPILIHNKLKLIGKNFMNGRQEDAHEFMRLLLENMDNSYLTAANGHKLDSRSKETTPLAQIFGGYYRDEVKCLKCHYTSTTFHPQAELQLDIRTVSSVEEGIALHFRREQLENNDYKCEKCCSMELATKQHYLETPPIVLCVQLKRFRQHGTKITKPIHVNKNLSLNHYIHPSSREKVLEAGYHLVGLISHIGTSQSGGHYTAIAEAQNGLFYHFDDSYVRLTNISNSNNSEAYVVIYEMNKTIPPPAPQKTTDDAATPVSPTAVPKTTPDSSKEEPTAIVPEEVPTTPAAPVEFPSLDSLDGSEVQDRANLPFAAPLNNMTVDDIIDKWCRATPVSTTTNGTHVAAGSEEERLPEADVVSPGRKRPVDQISRDKGELEEREDGHVVKKLKLDLKDDDEDSLLAKDTQKQSSSDTKEEASSEAVVDSPNRKTSADDQAGSDA